MARVIRRRIHYDVLGRVTSVVNALNGVVSTTYEKSGNVLTTQVEMGNVTSNVWNARNELIKHTLPDPDGSGPLTSPVWQWTHDADGNKLTQIDPMERGTSWTWGKLDRMTQETLPDPDGSGPLTSPVITIGYDNLGRKISEQDTYGRMGELLTTSDSLNDTTTDQYDSRFRLVQTTDASRPRLGCPAPAWPTLSCSSTRTAIFSTAT